MIKIVKTKCNLCGKKYDFIMDDLFKKPQELVYVSMGIMEKKSSKFICRICISRVLDSLKIDLRIKNRGYY